MVVGDKYIHFTKYGGINKGIVKWVGNTTHLIVDNGKLLYSYEGLYITNTLNISLKLDGTDGRIYKLIKENIYI